MTTLLTPPEIVDDVRRREFLGILAAAGLLAGCGGGDSASSSAEATRRVVDELGREVDVPVSPKRIALIDPLFTVAHLVDLGVRPFAVTVNSATPRELMPDGLSAALEEAESLGPLASVDAESLARVRPDLILFATPYNEGLDPEVLQQVAPTLAYGEEALSMDDSLRRVAGWIGREEKADQVISDWQSRLAALSAELDLGGRSFSMMLAYPDASAFNVDGPDSTLGRIVSALDGTLVPSEVDGEPIGEGAFGISLEVLPDLVEADTILLQRYNAEESDEALAGLYATPVWRSIEAVKRGDVVELDLQATSGSYGYAGLEAVVTQIAAAL